MTWLVRKDAVEGKDYEVDKVIAVWRTTGEQDWRLCADNQLGVNSRYYQPGPHTPVEAGPEQFDSWYINELLKP
jgi:Rieske 2Fe-2S family protein